MTAPERLPPQATPARRPQGLCFEELELGARFHSQARTLTEADIGSFAGLSGDFNPLHIDEVHARSTAFRGRVAHGLLVQALASGLAWQTGIFAGTIVALKSMTLAFTAAVQAGDTLWLELEVLGKDPAPAARRGEVLFAARVYKDGSTLVIDGQWRTLMQRAASVAAAGRRRS